MKKMTENLSRRKFLKVNTLGGVGAALSLNAVLPVYGSSAPRRLNIKPRYHRWHVDPGVEWLEKNTSHAHLNWSIPLSQTALVLVDVWQRHYLNDTEERTGKIIRNKLVPLINSCRKHDMPVIHAPSSPVAMKHPNWVNLLSESDSVQKRDDWPPQEFRSLSGPYKSYQRPFEPREEERLQLPELTFHPDIQPQPNEAVIVNGEELHRLCKKEGILFLFFAGFNTNACIISRDYGALQMSNRGYQVTLVRDCTTGMESAATYQTLAQTKEATRLLEMFGQYSILSNEIVQSLSLQAGQG